MTFLKVVKVPLPASVWLVATMVVLVLLPLGTMVVLLLLPLDTMKLLLPVLLCIMLLVLKSSRLLFVEKVEKRNLED